MIVDIGNRGRVKVNSNAFDVGAIVFDTLPG